VAHTIRVVDVREAPVRGIDLTGALIGGLGDLFGGGED
jgi:hypothetical protein